MKNLQKDFVVLARILQLLRTLNISTFHVEFNLTEILIHVDNYSYKQIIEFGKSPELLIWRWKEAYKEFYLLRKTCAETFISDHSSTSAIFICQVFPKPYNQDQKEELQTRIKNSVRGDYHE